MPDGYVIVEENEMEVLPWVTFTVRLLLANEPATLSGFGGKVPAS